MAPRAETKSLVWIAAQYLLAAHRAAFLYLDGNVLRDRVEAEVHSRGGVFMGTKLWARADSTSVYIVHDGPGHWTPKELARAVEVVQRFPRPPVVRGVAACAWIDDDTGTVIDFHWSSPEKPRSEPFLSVGINETMNLPMKDLERWVERESKKIRADPPVLTAACHRSAREMARSPEKSRKFLRDAGIIDKKGQLTKHYR